MSICSVRLVSSAARGIEQRLRLPGAEFAGHALERFSQRKLGV
jgi:hypothetical protein